MKKKVTITLLLDNPQSWMVPFANKLEKLFKKRGYKIVRLENALKIPHGECVFFLSCEKIVSEKILKRNRHNIVIHASHLPAGKGFSPLTWQILKGKSEIPLTLFEAVAKVDSGPIYLRDRVFFEGHELIGDLRNVLGKKIVEMAMKFMDDYQNLNGTLPKGKATFYPRIRAKDSLVNTNKPIKDIFNRLRVADNAKYPVFFDFKNHRYILKIYRRDNYLADKI